ncbi:MAG: carbohydrate-binding protein, partial [Rhodococcus sp. (in: high G+C Gram-positive bacteria)]
MVERAKSPVWSVAGASLCVATVAAATVVFGATPAGADGIPWLPVNSCGETGFNPAKEPPTPGNPLPQIPPTLNIPIPYPEFVPVPVPGPPADHTRVEQDLPADPCADPCPDLTDKVDEDP